MGIFEVTAKLRGLESSGWANGCGATLAAAYGLTLCVAYQL
jgi:hypothetical protein